MSWEQKDSLGGREGGREGPGDSVEAEHTLKKVHLTYFLKGFRAQFVLV